MVPAGEHAASPAPLYHSDLAQTPLPEILARIHRYKAPGAIECRRDSELKRIFLDGGRIIFATTSLIAESLGDMLLRDGRITQAQYDESLALKKLTGKRHGVTLVEMGILKPEELFTAVRAQIQEIINSVFAWTSGTVAFTPGRDKNLEFVKVEVPVPEAILRGVRRLGDAKRLVARLGNKAQLYERTQNPVEELTLSDDEQRLLDAVDGRRALVELVNLPPLPPSDNARILYAFFTLQLIAPRETRQIKVQIRTDGDKLGA